MSPFSRKLAAAALLFCCAAQLLAQPVLVGRVTHPVTDAQANGTVSDPALSGDGRFLYFMSNANTLGPPANGGLNLYRYDLSAATPAADSLILAASVLGNGNSFAPSVSGGGNRVAFESLATNFGGNDSGQADVFLGEAFALPQNEVGFDTTLVSRGLGGVAPNSASQYPSISENGQFVAFLSHASNLVAVDTNNAPDIFIANVDALGAPPERVSVDSNEVPITGFSFRLSNRAVSADGRFVVFNANSTIGGATSIGDIFLRDRSAGTTTLVSRLVNGTPFNSSSEFASISADARFIVFRSFASNGPGASGSGIWLRDRIADTLGSVPLPPQVASCEDPRVSNRADVIMQCSSSIIGVGQQAYLYRGSTGFLYRLSSTPSNDNGNASSGTFMDLSSDGYFIAFDSAASNLVAGDTNTSTDVFLTIDDEILNALFSDGFE